jgi:DNA-binding response OmpR family regulator
MIRVNLEKHFPDIEVEEATEGFRAGWKAFGFKPDVMILDLLLPGMDGFQVLEFLRGNDKLKHTRVIAVTAMDNEETRRKVRELGADEYLAKPFIFEDLRDKVLKVMKDNPQEKQAA